MVLPAGIDHNDGFYEGVHTVEHLADQVGAPVSGLVVDANPDQFERLFDLVEPDVPATFERIDGWDVLEDRLREDVDETSLVVPMSARRGTMGWHSALRTLPTTVARVTDGNFVVIYPAVGEGGDDRQFLQFR